MPARGESLELGARPGLLADFAVVASSGAGELEFLPQSVSDLTKAVSDLQGGEGKSTYILFEPPWALAGEWPTESAAGVPICHSEQQCIALSSHVRVKEVSGNGDGDCDNGIHDEHPPANHQLAIIVPTR